MNHRITIFSLNYNQFKATPNIATTSIQSDEHSSYQ